MRDKYYFLVGKLRLDSTLMEGNDCKDILLVFALDGNEQHPETVLV